MEVYVVYDCNEQEVLDVFESCNSAKNYIVKQALKENCDVFNSKVEYSEFYERWYIEIDNGCLTYCIFKRKVIA